MGNQELLEKIDVNWLRRIVDNTRGVIWCIECKGLGVMYDQICLCEVSRDYCKKDWSEYWKKYLERNKCDNRDI